MSGSLHGLYNHLCLTSLYIFYNSIFIVMRLCEQGRKLFLFKEINWTYKEDESLTFVEMHRFFFLSRQHTQYEIIYVHYTLISLTNNNFWSLVVFNVFLIHIFYSSNLISNLPCRPLSITGNFFIRFVKKKKKIHYLCNCY